MDARLARAASLARALLLLSRARRTGVLLVQLEQLEREPLRLRLRAGQLTGIGGLALEAAESSTAPRDDPRLCARLHAVLRCRSAGYRFSETRPSLACDDKTAADAARSTPVLVLEATRAFLAGLSHVERTRAVPTGRLYLSSLGRSMLSQATLRAFEASMVARLESGASRALIVREAPDPSLALFALATWSLLGLVSAVAEPSSGRYGLLLRKTNQLRRRADARALLDLPQASDLSPEQARRALRSLVPRVHPDALGDEREELQSASCEILSALIEAERSLARSSHAASGAHRAR